MLKLENVQKTYQDFRLNCSIEILSGCITGLIGQNGAGKTTVFKLLLGLAKAESGEVILENCNAQKLSKEYKEKIGVVLADSGLNGYLSVQDYIPVFEAMYHKFKKDDFLKLCDHFHIPQKKAIKEFSTGMKRKLQMITALTHDAEILLLDEPTSGMDVIAWDEILNLLRDYMVKHEDCTILISSHISSDLENLCDDIYMIDNGKIVLHEETDNLMSHYGILKVTKEQYDKLDHQYLLETCKESFGYSCLTAEKEFYKENYPQLAIENVTVDDVIVMMTRGDKE